MKSEILYILSAFLFIYGLKLLQRPDTARRGNLLSSLGMLVAVIVTLIANGIVSYQWILVGLVAGGVVGALSARLIAMTSMPELVALFNGSGGLASLLVATEAYHREPGVDSLTASTMFLSVLIGGVTFTGSIVAWAKLSERIDSRPRLFPGQQIVNFALLIGVIVGAVIFAGNPADGRTVFFAIVAAAFVLGVLAVIPIGGADMPVVISLLNSYSGLAACATGFVLQNNILIVTGGLVGASGIILTRIMCKAMNRSLANVLFSGFGSAKTGGTKTEGEVKPVSAEDAYVLLEAANNILVVPGYGLAVAQAQHVLRELGGLLQANDAEVRYAIHPVAGRMPGHMNVLLAEADVPYDELIEMDAVNPTMDTVDVCLVIGANDVVNPAAREDEASPIYGMPIIDVDRARTVIVFKRSMRPGFAGIENSLFFKDNTRMLFGDAKASLEALSGEFKSA
ncbi:MAG: NAD synthetase [Verrucomicrobiales bacterium]|nr:NAD synthetase [Verrucomicrobiales bacterium]